MNTSIIKEQVKNKKLENDLQNFKVIKRKNLKVLL